MTTEPKWQLRRKTLLQCACELVAQRLANGDPIVKALKAASRKFRNRSLGDGHKLRLGVKTMARAWKAWRAKKNLSAFTLHYRSGFTRHQIDAALLRRIALDCISRGLSLGKMLRTTRVLSKAGVPVSKRTLQSRLPAGKLKRLARLRRRIVQEQAELEQGRRDLVSSLGAKA